MKIDCTNDTLSAGNIRKQEDFLVEYNKLINKTTDVEIPFYNLDVDTFEKIWPPHEVDYDGCGFWRQILSENYEPNNRLIRDKDCIRNNQNNDPCSGKLTVESSIVFVNDVQYKKLSNNGSIESPGIYIKEPLKVDGCLFDFMVAYNMHLAETYYLSNRKAMNERFNSKDMQEFKSFIVSFLTIRSLFRKNKRIVKELESHHSSYLVGAWKVPFILLNRVPESKWKNVIENDEITFAIADIMSGESIEDVFLRLREILDKLSY